MLWQQVRDCLFLSFCFSLWFPVHSSIHFWLIPVSFLLFPSAVWRVSQCFKVCCCDLLQCLLQCVLTCVLQWCCIMYCSVLCLLQCVLTCVLQWCCIMYCSVLQCCVAVFEMGCSCTRGPRPIRFTASQCVAECCSMLPCVVACYLVLRQCVAAC